MSFWMIGVDYFIFLWKAFKGHQGPTPSMVLSTIWFLWTFRNQILYNNVVVAHVKVLDNIKSISWTWFISKCNVSPSIVFSSGLRTIWFAFKWLIILYCINSWVTLYSQKYYLLIKKIYIIHFNITYYSYLNYIS